MPPRILADDPAYDALLEKRFNKRFSARPDYIQRAGSADDVIAAVEEAVKEGRRLVVTSGKRLHKPIPEAPLRASSHRYGNVVFNPAADRRSTSAGVSS